MERGTVLDDAGQRRERQSVQSAQRSDTAQDIMGRMIDAYRRMPLNRKWSNLGEDWIAARAFHMAGYRQRHPDATAAEVRAHWMWQSCDKSMPLTFPNSQMSLTTFAPVLRHALRAFEKMGIGYALGGSMASSLHGIGRMTRDADVTVEPFPGREAELMVAFDSKDFYLSEDAIRLANRERFSFNILHPESGFKIDVFVLKDDAFEQSAFARRQFLTLADDPNQPIACYAPEDVVLFKLRWYRLGGEISEQQWSDILGVLRTQSGRLDENHLDHWAGSMGVADLLARVRKEV